MINYEKKVLSNGLRVILAPIKETKAVTVLLLINAGSRHESVENNGIFHFMEHMVFKGTKKRPTALDIAKELDSIGAGYNAFTSDEYTGFYVSATASHFDIVLDLLSDIVTNSQFPTKEIAKEKGVILEEINMYKDLPQRHIFDLAKKQIFGETALGRSTLGTAKTVSSIKRQDFIDLRSKYYHADNMIAVVAGASDKFDWLTMINDKLGSLSRNSKLIPDKHDFTNHKSHVNLNYKETDQAHLSLGFKTFSRFDNRRYAIRLLNNLLGETMSSRLFHEIREKRGLAYYIGSDMWEFNDTGAQVAFAGLDKKRLDMAIKVILTEYKKLTKSLVKKDELIRAKENIKGKTYLGLEDSFSIAEFLGEQELLKGEIIPPEKILAELFKITSTDIRNLAKQVFTPENLHLTIIGPVKDQKKYEELLENNL